jgi:hypothetical protein
MARSRELAMSAPAYSYALAFDGLNIWVANNGSNTVTKF